MTPRHATAAVACALGMLGWACASITGDAGAPVAIEFVGPAFSQRLVVQEFDTLPIGVHVLSRTGDTIPGAPIQLVSLNPDTLGVDSAPPGLIGLRPGHARVVATSGDLHSDPLSVTVVRAPDSLAIVGSSTDTVRAPDSVSAPLVVRLLDLRTDRTQALGLTGYPVGFAITRIDSAAAAAVLGNDSLGAVLLTGAGAGTASVTVIGLRPRPDSVVVQASAKRANGAVVRGSPVRFVVRFR